MPPRISKPPIVAPTATPAISPRDNPDLELGSGAELVSLLADESVVVSTAFGALTFMYWDFASVPPYLLSINVNQ
jgi:hypothetical protein